MNKKIIEYKNPIYLAHDHMSRYEDLLQDKTAGVSGKILHLTVDGWIDAPTRSLYNETYNTYDGFFERYISALDKLENIINSHSDLFTLIKNHSDLIVSKKENKLAIILGNEGGKIIGANLENFDYLYKRGLRHIQFNWSMKNNLSACQEDENSSSDTGLTQYGKILIEKMNESGMIIDISHSSPKTIKEVLDITTKPILNSHSGSRSLANKKQNLWDYQIKELSDNNGILAIHFCSRLVLGDNYKQASIIDVVKQIKYVKKIGGIDIIALGPDWILGDKERDKKYTHNTNQENISWTKNLENSKDIKNIIRPLESEGFTEREIDSILYKNMERFSNSVFL